jgi:hypothetical protein
MLWASIYRYIYRYIPVYTGIYWYIPLLCIVLYTNPRRGKPRLGGLSIEQTGERKKVASDARHKRAAETKLARKTA